MGAVEIILCLAFIALTAWLLVRYPNPQTVLLISGLLMLSAAAFLGSGNTGEGSLWTSAFSILQSIEDKFVTSIAKLGFMIMTIGGYVALMNHIKATDAMVFVATRPLSFLRGHAEIASVAIIPIGMLLYLTIPSASGLGLLLVSTIYPILRGLGASRMSSLAAVSAATIFDMGPGSANTLRGAEIAGIDSVAYFIAHQLPLIGPTVVVILVAYYFSNRYFDRKEGIDEEEVAMLQENKASVRPDVPLWYALLPVLPLAILIVFSPFLGIFDARISTASAMLACFMLTGLILLFREKKLETVLIGLKSFWDGMGSVFSSVVTLIVAAEIFAMGLTSLHFIDMLVGACSSIGLGASAVTVLMTVTVFFSAVMMGSGNAAFFSFGPLIPGIAEMFGISVLSILMPVQLCAGMGRAASPIAAVNVAVAGSAGVSPVKLAKRNAVPMAIGALFLLVLNFIMN